MLVFAAATQGYWLVKSRIWETAGLLLVAFTLFRPGFWWDRIYPPFKIVDPAQIVQIAEKINPEGKLRMTAGGENIDGEYVINTVLLPLGAMGPGAKRLIDAGVEIRIEDGKVFVDNLVFGSAAEQAGLDFDWEITCSSRFYHRALRRNQNLNFSSA